MNPLFHFFFNYVVVSETFGRLLAKENLLAIAVFSTILDLDHIPYLFKEGGRIFRDRFGSAGRSRLHELYGLVVFSLAFSCLYILSAEKALIQISALSVLLHLAVDFMVGKSRPFYPLLRTEVEFGSLSLNKRLVLESIMTVLLGGLFLLLQW